jgi:hypothetical protein
MLKHDPVGHPATMTPKGMVGRYGRMDRQTRGHLGPKGFEDRYWKHRHGTLRRLGDLSTVMIPDPCLYVTYCRTL